MHLEILTVEEVGKVLRVSKQTVRTLIKEGTLPAKKVGRSWRILKEDIEAFMKETD